MKRGSREVFLSTGADEVFLPLVTSFVENAALCFGLGRDEALGLTLAAEEVFMHFCRLGMPAGDRLNVRSLHGGYYVQTDFSFSAVSVDMRAFNLAATVSTEDEGGLEELGLVIASRLVDRFQLSREKGDTLRLSLIKEKSYPLQGDDVIAVARSLTDFTLQSPEREEVKFIAHLARAYYESRHLSDFLMYPGKLADMIGGGEFQALAAVGPAGEIGGAILWHWMGKKMIECFGPYVFNQSDDSLIPEVLLEGCIGRIARTQAVGLISTRPTPQMPKNHFEPLGSISVYAEDGSSQSLQARLRLMKEDMGSVVWAHPDLRGFLNHEYERLVLPREIRFNQNSGETLSRHSVLSVEFDRVLGRATLHPMWPGSDAEENLTQHVKLLRQEGLLNILFAMDLGAAWQADFTPGLLRNGFEPCLVLPYAGEGDVVLFQFGGEVS